MPLDLAKRKSSFHAGFLHDHSQVWVKHAMAHKLLTGHIANGLNISLFVGMQVAWLSREVGTQRSRFGHPTLAGSSMGNPVVWPWPEHGPIYRCLHINIYNLYWFILIYHIYCDSHTPSATRLWQVLWMLWWYRNVGYMLVLLNSYPQNRAECKKKNCMVRFSNLEPNKNHNVWNLHEFTVYLVYDRLALGFAFVFQGVDDTLAHRSLILCLGVGYRPCFDGFRVQFEINSKTPKLMWTYYVNLLQ